MVAMGHRSHISSVNSNSASVLREEVVLNVGPLAGVVTLHGAMPIVFSCNPGDDILMKISLDCESHNRTLVAIISMQGIVMSPRILYENGQLQMHKGACTLLSMNTINNPLGNHGGSASTFCTISIVGADCIPYGGRLAGPLIAASQISGVLFVNPLINDSDDEDDSNGVSDEDEDSDSGSCLSSE